MIHIFLEANDCSPLCRCACVSRLCTHQRQSHDDGHGQEEWRTEEVAGETVDAGTQTASRTRPRRRHGTVPPGGAIFTSPRANRPPRIRRRHTSWGRCLTAYSSGDPADRRRRAWEDSRRQYVYVRGSRAVQLEGEPVLGPHAWIHTHSGCIRLSGMRTGAGSTRSLRGAE